MELVQIAQPATVTFQQLIEQMAAQQGAEIEQLRQDALTRQSAAQAEERQPHVQSATVASRPEFLPGDSAAARSRSASL